MPIAGNGEDVRTAAMAKTMAAVDATFARRLRLSPMKDGAPDPERPQHPFRAPLRVSAGEDQMPKGGGGKSWAIAIASGVTMVAIDRGTYDGPPILQHDRIRDLSLGDTVYEVARIDDRDDNRLILELNEI